MRINFTNSGAASGFYIVDHDIFIETISESEITNHFDLGKGLRILHGLRYGDPIWLLDNPLSGRYGIWVEADNDPRPRH
jgi:hypothetical protein